MWLAMCAAVERSNCDGSQDCNTARIDLGVLKVSSQP